MCLSESRATYRWSCTQVNRVGYGILQAADLDTLRLQVGASAVEAMPKGRRLLAVPFVGKDVPSSSSEFANPDVVVGLTLLAYRYDGLRQADIENLTRSLKVLFATTVIPGGIVPDCTVGGTAVSCVDGHVTGARPCLGAPFRDFIRQLGRSRGDG